MHTKPKVKIEILTPEERTKKYTKMWEENEARRLAKEAKEDNNNDNGN